MQKDICQDVRSPMQTSFDRQFWRFFQVDESPIEQTNERPLDSEVFIWSVWR
jgi:hypothetical protein